MTTTFGQALTAARQQQHLSQKALAALVGVHSSAVAQWEQATTKPRNDHLFALERALRLAPGALARHLGVGPPTDAPARSLPGVVEAIRSDRSLTEQAQRLLVELYQQLRTPPRPRRAPRAPNRNRSNKL